MSADGEDRRRARTDGYLPVDALFLVLPAVLVGLRLLPVDLQGRLLFSYDQPTLLAAYATHFVGLSWPGRTSSGTCSRTRLSSRRRTC